MAEKAIVERVEVPAGRRIVAVSDIHGNQTLFQKLLEQVGFSERDELFLLGDYVEKGQGSLSFLRWLMTFSQHENVHLLMGNCDTVWEDVLTDEDCNTLHYMQWRRESILNEMCGEIGFSVDENTDIKELRAALRPAFSSEMEFLRGLPHILETPRFIFVHAGLDSPDIDAQNAWSVMKSDSFLEKGLKFPRTVVVGHMPTNNYCKTIGCVNPIDDRDSRIISIDGGNVIRAGGQLNALLAGAGGEEISFAAADMLPEAEVIRPQEASANPVYIGWAENAIELLTEGDELSLCRQLCSGKKLLIANEELLRFRDGSLHCGEATDYLLPVQPGERVRLIRRFRARSYCKKAGTLGWILNTCLAEAGDSSPAGAPPYAGL